MEFINPNTSKAVIRCKRPKGQEVLKVVNSGKLTDLFVEEVSRLGRNAYDTLTTLQICEENNVNVHIQNMNVSSRVNEKANPLFKMFSHIFAVIAEQEREQIKERTKMGKSSSKTKRCCIWQKARI